MRRIAAVACVVAWGLPEAASADDQPATVPLSFGLPQIGLGVVTRGANELDLPKTQFDGTLRFSPAKTLTRELRIGGFVELRTAGFDTFELGLGPHVMYSLTELWAVQLRTGVAAIADGPNYALVGFQIGNAVISLTFTGRRLFDDGRQELSVNLELTTGLLLAPFFRGIASP